MGKKQYFTFLLVLLLSILIFTPTVLADDSQTYRVDTQSLNVRIAPDRDAKIIGQLKFGDHLVAFDEKYGWAQTYYKGEKVWVATQYLTQINSNNHNQAIHKNDQQTITIQYNFVRLRTGPGTNHSIIDHTFQGETFPLIKVNGDWLNVLLDNGSTAWVASWLTDHHSTPNNNEETPIHTEGVLKGYNIILDPGHGGIDSGALSINGEQEKDFTLTVANAVAEKLREAGATVLFTRSNNSYVSLEDRVKISHSYWTDAFISLHYDAFPLHTANGISTHYYGNGQDARLAEMIQTALNKHTGLKNRGTLNSPYYVLRENNKLSVLVELGFITNPNDLAIIQNANHPTDVANAITDGVINYFTSQ